MADCENNGELTAINKESGEVASVMEQLKYRLENYSDNWLREAEGIVIWQNSITRIGSFAAFSLKKSAAIAWVFNKASIDFSL